MPRRSSGPRLWWDRNREAFTIIDGRSNHRTGFGAAEIRRAEAALREYIEKKHKPAKSETPLLADVLAAYAEEHLAHKVSVSHILYDIRNLIKWWGEKRVEEITGKTCRAYVAFRKAPGCSRRELAFLGAAIMHWHREHGPLRMVPVVVLPPKPASRTNFMTRSQAAQFLWCARRTPHLARFFLLGWYTGSRRSVIAGLKWSMVDLETGIMKRKESNAPQTKKRSPPVRLGRRLLCHLRRWHKMDGDLAGHIVNFRGRKISRPCSSWERVRNLAGLPDYVTPHVLRHSRATHMMQQGVDAWEAANALGMSLEVLTKVYGHHHPDWQKAAANAR